MAGQTKRRRIALCIASMGSGGAERVMSLLCAHWSEDSDVRLITLAPEGSGSHYPLPSDIEHVELGLAVPSQNKAEAILNNLKRLRKLRHAITSHRPDVVLSFVDGMNALVLMATRGTRLPVVVSDRIDPRVVETNATWKALRVTTYTQATRIVVQTHAVQESLPAPLRRRALVVPNPVPRQDAQALFTSEPKSIVAAGRLVTQKGFDRLLDAFALVHHDFPEWKLTIWGEGSDRSKLEAQRDKLGLTEKVSLPGVTKELPKRLSEGHLFVLSSRYEGFPNVLCEAMAVGLPVVAFRCPSGPSEIVRHGLDGLLVAPGDVPELAETMRKALEDETLRLAMAKRAPEVAERFSVERVMSIWDGVLEQAIGA